MNKRLPFLPTVIIVIATAFLAMFFYFWLKANLNLPDWNWISFILWVVAMYLPIEVASRLGPKKFDTPATKFLKLSTRDKVVSLIAFLAFLIIAFPIGTRFDSIWLKFLFLGLGFLVFWLICFFFGSKELNQIAPNHEVLEEDKISEIIDFAEYGEIDGLVKIIDNEPDVMICLEAAMALAQLEDERGLDFLIGALNNPDLDVNSAAREILVELNHPKGNLALQSH